MGGVGRFFSWFVLGGLGVKGGFCRGVQVLAVLLLVYKDRQLV